MGRSAIPPALAELANPTSSEAQVVALRNLKNEVVGHEQRKELAVTYGVVGLLAGLLGEGVRRGGKRHGNGAREGSNGETACVVVETAYFVVETPYFVVETSCSFADTASADTRRLDKGRRAALPSYISGRQPCEW
jgi:hypothetical protein